MVLWCLLQDNEFISQWIPCLHQMGASRTFHLRTSLHTTPMIKPKRQKVSHCNYPYCWRDLCSPSRNCLGKKICSWAHSRMLFKTVLHKILLAWKGCEETWLVCSRKSLLSSIIYTCSLFVWHEKQILCTNDCLTYHYAAGIDSSGSEQACKTLGTRAYQVVWHRWGPAGDRINHWRGEIACETHAALLWGHMCTYVFVFSWRMPMFVLVPKRLKLYFERIIYVYTVYLCVHFIHVHIYTHMHIRAHTMWIWADSLPSVTMQIWCVCVCFITCMCMCGPLYETMEATQVCRSRNSCSLACRNWFRLPVCAEFMPSIWNN